MDFDGVVSSLEAIWAVFQHLIGQLIPQLVRRGRGARRLEVELLRPHAPPLHHSILLSRPLRDAVNLFNLFRCAMEGSGFGVQGSGKRTAGLSSLNPEPRTLNPHLLDSGYIGMRLTASLHEPLSDEQISLLAHEEYAGQMELDRLIERLAIRLGEGSILRPQLAESHVPEKAWAVGKECNGVSECRGVGVRRRKSTPTPRHSVTPSQSFPLPRPLHLLPCPLELRVMVSPSDDAEGQPVAFTYERTVRRVVHAVGPERIAGQWWEGNDKTRDYFDVEETSGQRFWIFRVRQTGKWYLHGIFE